VARVSRCAAKSYAPRVTNSPLPPEEIRAAAEVHRELGPQYSDAVVESFLEKIDAEVEARIAARIAALPPVHGSRPGPSALARRRAFLAGAAAGLAGAGIPLTVMAAGLARDAGDSNGQFIALWVVIGVIFAAMAAGLTGAVTIRVSVSARKRRARSAPVAAGQEGRPTT
jgi:hypothetical protein